MAYSTPEHEHAGQYISAFYWNIAEPNFSLPPDLVSQAGDLVVSSHKLSDARLITISNRGAVSRYMRFHGLAADIPADERELLGFPSSHHSEDLVIACAGQPSSKDFSIVPSAAIHSVRERRLAMTQLSAGKMPSASNLSWLSVSGDKYSKGIYRHTDRPAPEHIEDVTDQLPETRHSCLSVAGLLVTREIESFTR